jgi:hypothetical protein
MIHDLPRADLTDKDAATWSAAAARKCCRDGAATRNLCRAKTRHKGDLRLRRLYVIMK